MGVAGAGEGVRSTRVRDRRNAKNHRMKKLHFVKGTRADPDLDAIPTNGKRGYFSCLLDFWDGIGIWFGEGAAGKAAPETVVFGPAVRMGSVGSGYAGRLGPKTWSETICPER